MYRKIYSIVKNAYDTEDILQNFLVKLIDKIETLRHLEKGRQISYVVSTCDNTAKNHCRDNRQIFVDFTELEGKASGDADIELAMIHVENLKRLSDI